METVERYIRLGDVFINQGPGPIVKIHFWNESDGLHGEITTADGDTTRTGSDAQANKLKHYLADHAFDANVH